MKQLDFIDWWTSSIGVGCSAIGAWYIYHQEWLWVLIYILVIVAAILLRVWIKREMDNQ